MDTAILLLVVEGVPFLALVYYLIHKKQMFMLERGIEKKEDRYVRSERRIINGLFLTLAGLSMILAPKLGPETAQPGHPGPFDRKHPGSFRARNRFSSAKEGSAPALLPPFGA